MSGLSLEDRGFTLGDGVFDTALALGGIVFAGEMHLARLIAAAHAIGIAIDPARIDAAIDAALTPIPAIIRTTITRGVTARGLWPASSGVPTLVVSSAPWSPALLGKPVSLITAQGRRNEFSLTANLKVTGYLDQILAARDAAQAGVDDALILNTQGRVACTTIANIFAVKDQRLITPPLSEGCLPGIMRALVIETAERMGLEVTQAPLSPAELRTADAAFITNSVRFLRRVVTLDGLHLSDQTAAGELVTRLEAQLFERVRLECGVEFTVPAADKP